MIAGLVEEDGDVSDEIGNDDIIIGSRELITVPIAGIESPCAIASSVPRGSADRSDE